MQHDLIYKRGKLIHLRSMQHITPMASDPLKQSLAFAQTRVTKEMEKRGLPNCDAGQDF